jgi:uncharacterized protein (TIGR02271 family)
MQEKLLGASVMREDGIEGKITNVTTNGGTAVVIIRFADGAEVAVAPEMLSPRQAGAYQLALSTPRLTPTSEAEGEIVIPVLAEEVMVGKQQVTRGGVRVHKRVATREEVVDAPISAEEVLVERLPINAFVSGDPPQVREEDGVVIIPVLEEVLVVEKRLFLREEVRLTTRITQSSVPQTVLLRHEVVDIERFEGATHAGAAPQSASAGVEHTAADGTNPAEPNPPSS